MAREEVYSGGYELHECGARQETAPTCHIPPGVYHWHSSHIPRLPGGWGAKLLGFAARSAGPPLTSSAQ